LPAGLAGCSSALKQTSSSPAVGGSASGGTIKIGFVSPETGQLSVFTQSNGYVLASRGLWVWASDRFGWSLLPVGYRVRTPRG
jgi:cyanate permease